MRTSFKIVGVVLGMTAGSSGIARALEIAVQGVYPPLQFTDAAPGGAHPLGGPGKAFIDHANSILSPLGITFTLHASGNINPADAASVKPPRVAIRDFGTIHKAVAQGATKGGLDAATGIPADSKLAFGEMMSGGLPFGLEADELIAFVYAGGGLELVQTFYDEAFEGGIKVLPIGITTSQGPGFFKEPLPDPDTDKSLTARQAMAKLCNRPIIIRWPETASAVWSAACKAAGVETTSIGSRTRCKDAAAICNPAKNPGNEVVFQPKGLTFGGFTPGVIPQSMYANGNIDAYEFNMPTEDVQFLKLIKRLQNKPNAEVDLRDVAPAYSYAGSWHQQTVFVELLINKALWNGLSERDRALIEAVARSSVLSTLAIRLNMQGDAMKELERHGVTHLRWPQGLLEELRAAAPTALAQVAAQSSAKGDTTFERLYKAIHAYQAKQAAYFDYGDVNQGSAKTPTSPKK